MRPEDLARLGLVVRPAAGHNHPGVKADAEGLTPEQIESRRLVGDPDRYSVIIGSGEAGLRSGIVDIDTDTVERVDPETGEIVTDLIGEASLAEAGIAMPPGPWMQTPSGSIHRLVRIDVPEGQEIRFGSGLLPKVDVPWQFFAIDEDRRKWHDTHLPIPDAPPELVEKLLRPKTVRPDGQASDPYEGDGNGDPRAVAWVERLIDRYKDLPWEGHGWNEAFRKAVHTAAGLVRGGMIASDWAEEALLGACQDPAEALAVFQSSWKHGYDRPIDRMRVEGQAEERTEPVAQSGTVLSWKTAAELASTDFPPVRWVVPGLLPEGLTLMAGKPKVGKSWFVLDLGGAVADGGDFLGRSCRQGDVLYLALEDTERRLADRMSKLGTKSDRLYLTTAAPRMPDLLPALEEWAVTVERPRLIVVDVLGHIRPMGRDKQDAYEAAYEVMTPLQQFAGRHQLGVILIHHTRKSGAEPGGDPLDAVSGSMGQAGAADTVAVLTQNKLMGRGRDVEEFHLSVMFDKTRHRWVEHDPVAAMSEIQKTMMEQIKKSGPVKLADLPAPEGVNPDTWRGTASDLVKAGHLTRPARGTYAAS